MSQWHDFTDTEEQLKKDAEDVDHTPDSVRESAIQELRKRGYSESQIQNIRLYGKT